MGDILVPRGDVEILFPIFEIASCFSIPLKPIKERLELKHEWYVKHKAVEDKTWRRRKFKTKKSLSWCKVKEVNMLRSLDNEYSSKLNENLRELVIID